MTGIYVSAFGLSTAFGRGLAAISTARNESKLPFTRRRDLIGNDFRPQLCAFAPGIGLDGVEARAKTLVAEALSDLSDVIASRRQGWAPAHLVLLTPCADIGLDARMAARISDLIDFELQRTGWVASHRPSVKLQGDAATTVLALRAAAEFTALGQPVLLIAVDSFACRTRLNALHHADALFSAENPWGFVPGEAALAALIEPTGKTTPPVLHIMAAADAVEPVPARAERDSAFTGLSDAALAALERMKGLGISAPDQLISDWNNSRYRASELSYAIVRMTGLLPPERMEPEYPAQTFGHVGAGWLSAVVAAVQEAADIKDAAEAFLVLCGSEHDGSRGAFVLSNNAAAVK